MVDFSIFNHRLKQFEALDAVSFDMFDMLAGPLPKLLGEKPVVAAINMYGIPKTMHRALRQLEQRYPGCYVTVFQAPRHLAKLVSSELNLKLVADTTFPPSEVKEPESWKAEFATQALEADCHGVVVDFPCVDLAQSYPHSVILRRQIAA